MKRAIKTSLAYLIVIALFIIMFTGCGKAGTQGTDENHLTFYVMKSGTAWYQSDAWIQCIESFRSLNKDIKVEIVEFESYDALELQQSAELAANGGPDIILFDLFNSGVDMVKMAKNGAFLSMTEYFDNDSTFNRENYTTPVLDAGVVNDKQYVIPVAYDIPGLMTSEEKLTEVGFDIPDEDYSMRDYLSMVSQTSEFFSDDNSRYAYLNFNQMYNLRMYIVTSGLLQLDYGQGTFSLDKAKFKELLDSFITLTKEQQKAESVNSPSFDDAKALANGIFFPDAFSVYDNTSHKGAILNIQVGQTPVYLGMPSYDNNSEYYAILRLAAAINKNTKSPDAAYRFIRYAMDNTIRQGSVASSSMYYYSLNRETFKSFLLSVANTRSYLGYRRAEMEKIYPVLEHSADNVVGCVHLSYDVKTIILDAVTPYLEGRDIFDNCYETLTNKLSLYLSE